MSILEAIASMERAGIEPEKILLFAKDMLAKEEEKKELQREAAKQRQRKSRARHAMSHDVTVTECDSEKRFSDFPKVILSSPSKISPKGDTKGSQAFAEFWAAYPRKVARGKAEKAFLQALKKTDAATIMAGLQRFIPTTADKETEYIAYPSSWLNAERWLDDYTRPPPQKTKQIPTRAPHKNELIL